MRIDVVTSLYPSPQRPHEGIFAERRWQGMRARGHDVRIIQPLPRAPGPLARGERAEIAAMPRREERDGLPVERPRYWHLPGRARGNAQRFARCGAKSLDGRADVVVCDYAWPAAALAPLIAGTPCVINGRGSDVLQVAGEAGLGAELASYLRASTGWMAVSQDLVDAMDALAQRAGHGRLVPNGVDTELFHPRDRGDARGRLGLDAEGQLVLVVGHLIQRKDPLLALGAFAAGAPAGARLVFVGKGPLHDDVQAEIDRLGIGERARLMGERPPGELADWYAACDLLVLTSWREGRPNVVLEALASGRPVLATRAGGTAEILPEARMLGEERDAALLGKQLGALLQSPPAPETLHDHVRPLSWSAGLATLEEVLESAIAQCRKVSG